MDGENQRHLSSSDPVDPKKSSEEPGEEVFGDRENRNGSPDTSLWSVLSPPESGCEYDRKTG